MIYQDGFGAMGYLKQDGCGAMGYLKQDGCGAFGYLITRSLWCHVLLNNKMAMVPCSS